MATDIAIVGMACCYPDAPSPVELWENSLAQRRAFRRFPAERLSLAQYTSADQQAPDYTYATDAAVIEGYEFDRVKFRVAGSTYRSADLAHWLALGRAGAAPGLDGGVARQYPDWGIFQSQYYAIALALRSPGCRGCPNPVSTSFRSATGLLGVAGNPV